MAAVSGNAHGYQDMCDLMALRRIDRFAKLSKDFQRRISLPYKPEASLGCGINAASDVFGKPFLQKSLQEGIEKHHPKSNQKCWKASSSRESQSESLSAASMEVSGPCFEVGGGFSMAQERSKSGHLAESFIVHAFESSKKKMLKDPKLSPAAKNLLKNKGLHNFVEQYGTHYIAGYLHAASFIGLAKTETETEKEAKELAVKVHFAVSLFGGKAGGSAEYRQKNTQIDQKYAMKSRVSITGLEVHHPVSNVATLWEAYNKFIEAAKKESSESPYLLICAPWSELEEFHSPEISEGYQKLERAVDKKIELTIYNEVKRFMSVYDYPSGAAMIGLSPTLQHFDSCFDDFSKNNQGNKRHMERLTQCLLMSSDRKVRMFVEDKLQKYIPPIGVKKRYHISLIDDKNYGQEGWYLTAHRYFDKDRRNDHSTYAIVHDQIDKSGRSGPTCWEIKENNGAHTISLIDDKNYKQSGWRLTAHRYFDRDKRNDHSTRAIIHNPKIHKSGPSGSFRWKIKVVDTGKYAISLIDDKDYGQSGWSLSAHRQSGEDERNIHSTYAIVHDQKANPSHWKIVEAF